MPTKGAMNNWHVAVAAESLAASLFARCGCDVSVQYGADQPEYDLIIAKGARMLKVSVMGSQDGSWGLTQSHLKDADYHAAAEIWHKKHKERTILCFVQFKDVALEQMPSVYLAKPLEVAQRLKETAKGRGDTILYMHHEWSNRAHAAGTIERIPEAWRFTAARLDDLLQCA